MSQETEFGRFFKFENLTFCPINIDLIEPTLLPPHQTTWLNDYNAEVLEKLSPLLSEEEIQWLTHECRAVATR
ncbi:MAG: M24 family metallopeptidase C-terminal domain-containing protein [Akkermansiaceae bacterium]